MAVIEFGGMELLGTHIDCPFDHVLVEDKDATWDQRWEKGPRHPDDVPCRTPAWIELGSLLTYLAQAIEKSREKIVMERPR